MQKRRNRYRLITQYFYYVLTKKSKGSSPLIRYYRKINTFLKESLTSHEKEKSNDEKDALLRTLGFIDLKKPKMEDQRKDFVSSCTEIFIISIW